MILWTAITVGPHLNYKAKKFYEAVYCKLTSLTKQAAKKGIQVDTQLEQTDEDSAQGQGSLHCHACVGRHPFVGSPTRFPLALMQ